MCRVGNSQISISGFYLFPLEVNLCLNLNRNGYHQILSHRELVDIMAGWMWRKGFCSWYGNQRLLGTVTRSTPRWRAHLLCVLSRCTNLLSLTWISAGNRFHRYSGIGRHQLNSPLSGRQFIMRSSPRSTLRKTLSFGLGQFRFRWKSYRTVGLGSWSGLI